VKICPLKLINNPCGNSDPTYVECIKEECAWWNDYAETCAVLLIAIRLYKYK